MLDIDGLSVRFDGDQALRDLSLAIPAGARIGLLGPNGSGKTTLFNAISGLVPISSGTIRLGGQPISQLAPHHVARAGVARTFQTLRLFNRLSVLENALPAASRDAHERARAALDMAGLDAHRHTLAGDLGFYEQRRLEIARAIATEPCLLLADEPTAGLSQAESDTIVDLLDRAFATTTTILLIEHKIAAIEALCPRALLLIEGHLAADAATHDMLRDPKLSSMYFGSS